MGDHREPLGVHSSNQGIDAMGGQKWKANRRPIRNSHQTESRIGAETRKAISHRGGVGLVGWGDSTQRNAIRNDRARESGTVRSRHPDRAQVGGVPITNARQSLFDGIRSLRLGKIRRHKKPQDRQATHPARAGERASRIGANKNQQRSRFRHAA